LTTAGALSLVSSISHAASATDARATNGTLVEDRGGAETLQKTKLESGGYGAPEVRMSAVSGEAAALMGVQGGWILAHSLTLGIAGYGLASWVDAPREAQAGVSDARVNLAYGGMRVGFVFAPERLLHVTTAILVGGGVTALVEDPADGSDSTIVRSHTLFALEPEIGLEMNVTTFLRVCASTSYRYLSDSGIAGLSASKLSAPAAGLAMKFGSF
jgi:hypothetical protein